MVTVTTTAVMETIKSRLSRTAATLRLTPEGAEAAVTQTVRTLVNVYVHVLAVMSHDCGQ